MIKTIIFFILYIIVGWFVALIFVSDDTFDVIPIDKIDLILVGIITLLWPGFAISLIFEAIGKSVIHANNELTKMRLKKKYSKYKEQFNIELKKDGAYKIISYRK